MARPEHGGPVEGGDPACWSGVFDDEAELSNKTLSDVLRNLNDAVVMCRSSGEIVFWNHAAETLFGWSSADATGRTLDLIIPERLRKRHWAGWRRAMDTGVTAYADRLLEVPAVRADGAPISIAFTVTLIVDEPRRTPSLVVAVVRDQTESWEERRNLRAEVDRLRAAAEPPG